MRNISAICTILLYSIQINAQETSVKQDSSRRIQEVKITAQAKKKIETEMKMAVSVDEFLASSDQISFIKRGGVCVGAFAEQYEYRTFYIDDRWYARVWCLHG